MKITFTPMVYEGYPSGDYECFCFAEQINADGIAVGENRWDPTEIFGALDHRKRYRVTIRVEAEELE